MKHFILCGLVLVLLCVFVHSVVDVDASNLRSAASCAPGRSCVRLLQCPEVDRMALVHYLSRPPHLRSPAERRWELSHWQRCPLADGEYTGTCCPSHSIDEINVLKPSLPAEMLPYKQDELFRLAIQIGALELEKFLPEDGNHAENLSSVTNYHSGASDQPDDVLPPVLVREGLQNVLTWQALEKM